MTSINTFTDELLFTKIPGENFLLTSLQKDLIFYLGNKTIKQGKLLLFKRSHFFIQITLLNAKKEKENFEIPFPFKIEEYDEEGVMYFDYRVETLNVENLPPIKNKVSSSYFNKILEIAVKD